MITNLLPKGDKIIKYVHRMTAVEIEKRIEENIKRPLENQIVYQRRTIDGEEVSVDVSKAHIDRMISWAFDSMKRNPDEISYDVPFKLYDRFLTEYGDNYSNYEYREWLEKNTARIVYR